MKDKLISLFGKSWFDKLSSYLLSKEFLELGKTINNLRLERKIYPEGYNVFRSFKESNVEDINVVFLINQRINQFYCHPVCECESYSNSKLLRNWRRELITEYPEIESRLLVKGTLDWQDMGYLRDQGIFFLNTQLTDDDRVGFKHEYLWKPFISQVVKVLTKDVDIIWVLLGDSCFKYEKLISLQSKVIKTPYPSLDKFVENNGLFRKINFELEKDGRKNIEW